MLDWEGNMSTKRHRAEHILDMDVSVNLKDYDVAIDETMASAYNALTVASICAVEHSRFVHNEFNDFSLALIDQVEQSKMKMSLGSTSMQPIANDPLFESSTSSHSNLDNTSLESINVYDEYLDYTVGSLNAGKPTKVSPEFLSKIWHIKPDLAKKTLLQTTQRYRQGLDNELSRRFSSNDRMLRYRRIDSHFYTDTFFVTAKGKSTRGNTCAQLFVSDKGYIALYLMKSKGQYLQALQQFCKDVGIPSQLLVDPSGEQTSRNAKNFCNKVGTTLKILEESTQWANRAELYIGLIKESIQKDLSRQNSPMKLWDYCAERRVRIHNVTPRDLFQLNGNNPTTATFGELGDISNISQFDWYDWCYFREESTQQFPFQKRQLGRVLGPLINEGNEMTQAVLTITGKIVPRCTCTRLTEAELKSPSEIVKRKKFDEIINKLYGDSMALPPSTTKPIDLELSDLVDDVPDEPLEICDDNGVPITIMPEDPTDEEGTSIYEKPLRDMLVHAEVLLPQGEQNSKAKVLGPTKDNDGKIVGVFDKNPLLNSIVYDVKFPDGELKQYSANMIAQNIYQQVDTAGHSTVHLEAIIDYKRDRNAVPMEQKHILTKSGQRRFRKSTIGWKLLVRFRNGTVQWIPLRTLKETNPIEVAEYAIAHAIDKQPAFHWWVHYTLKERDRIVATVESRVKLTKHKYGIQVPMNIKEAIILDQQSVKNSGEALWQDAIDLEMANVKVAFEILDTDQRVPIGWMKSRGHLVFDIKMDFTRKARWVKDGHKTPTPVESTYAGVVSRESVRIALSYAALNDIDVMAEDIKNAYLQAPSSEKHYIICGTEFGVENVGKVALIRRALYGGKSSGSDFWKHLRSCMTHLGFKSCSADPNIWMREALKDDRTEYWEYVLLYVDDALCISQNAEEVLRKQIGKYFYIKPKSVGPPSIYLGNKVSKVTLENGKQAWAFSSSQYVKNAVENVENHLRKQNKSLPKRVKSPLSVNYRPEIDTTPELDAIDASYYQSLIGILRWIVELGRIDVTCEASLMASCMALPRQGHLDQVYQMFAYLKAKHNSEMVFNPTEPELNIDLLFPRENWRDTVYGDCNEELPANIPNARGYGFKLIAYVDSDHAGDSITRRSRTGFIVYLNGAPIYWTSKKQGSIETSSFGSEFIAMKNCCEYLRGLRYKLRMMGIPCDFPSFVHGDNKSVLVNSTKPFSMLKKKSCSIAYHFVREGVAKDEWRVTYINTNDNVADLLTKPLPGGD